MASISKLHLLIVLVIDFFRRGIATGGEHESLSFGQMMRQTLSNHPRVYLLDGFLNRSEVTHLLKKSQDMGLSLYQPLPSGYSNPDRSSHTENIPEEGYLSDSVISVLEQKMSALTNNPLDMDSGATIQLAYRNASGSGILDLHHDHNAIAMDIMNAGLPASRRPSLTLLFATIIGYLVDTESGGETVFPCICDRSSKKCSKNQQACSFLYERGVLNVHMAGHNTPFKTLNPSEEGEVAKRARYLAKAADDLCKGKTKVGIRVTPRAGVGLLFFSNNVRGIADPRAWHGGCKVTKGLKQTMQRFLHAPQGREETGQHAKASFEWTASPPTSPSLPEKPPSAAVKSKKPSKPEASKQLELPRFPGNDASLDSLDAQQRAVAAGWNPSCKQEESQWCMAEPMKVHLDRTYDKLQAVVDSYPKDQVISGMQISNGEGNLVVTKALPQAMPYAYNRRQLNSIPREKSLDLRIPKVPAAEGDRRENFHKVVVDHMRGDGLALLQKAVREDACLEAMKQLLAWAAAGGSNMTERVMKPKHRHHLRLPLHEPALRPAIQGILNAVGPTIQRSMSASAHLIELAAFITNPGAESQYFHHDVPESADQAVAPYYTVLLFLTDVAENGGRFEVIPRTHALSEYKDMLLAAQDRGKKVWLAVPAQAGDVLVYDGSLVHRGTANQADRPRVVLYMTFAGHGAHPCCHTFAINTDLLRPPAGPITLQTLDHNFRASTDKHEL